jgi:APA family basic amino acid/polyamine antiporter
LAEEAGGLRRGLGLRTTVATSTGLAFSAFNFLGAVTVALFVAGDAAWLAILVAGLLALLAASAFGELNSLYPSAAAIRVYMKHSMDDRVALTIALTYMLTIVLVIAADAFIIGRALQYVLFPTQVLLSFPIIAVLILVAVVANLRGVRIAGRVEEIATFTTLAITTGVSVWALSIHGFQLKMPVTGFFSGRDANPLAAVVAGVFLFSAFEWVTTTSEEVRSPQFIPQSMGIALVLLYIATAAFAMALTSWFPDHGFLRDKPYPQLLLAQRALGTGGLLLMLFCTGLTAINTFNGGFLTASRFIYATAREGKLPAMFARLNDNAVPHVPVIVLGVASLVVATVVYVSQSWLVLVAVGAALEAMIYAVAAYCVITLRRRQPGMARAQRMPLGYVTPVLALVVFSVLTLAASFTDPSNPAGFSVVPLVSLLVAAGLAAAYVFLGVPRLERSQAARAPRRPRRPPPQSG